jgi:hypothetical protein
MAGRIVIALLVTLSAAANAQTIAMVDAPRTLAWRAPAECPDARSLRDRVERRLERSLDDVVVGVEVDVALVAGRYTARIDLRALTVANDIRTLTSRRCDDLADAVAVIVARVASEQIARRRVATRDDDSEVVAAVKLQPLAAAPPHTWSIGARVAGVSGIGVIPKVGLGGEVALTLRRHNVMAELAGTRWFASTAQSHDGSPPKVDVDLDTAAARAGWRPVDLPLRAWLAVEAGHIYGNNIALPSQQVESGTWLAAGAGFGVAWQMTKWLRLLGTTETMIAIERVRFTLDGVAVYAPSPMSFRTTCGLEVGWQ